MASTADGIQPLELPTPAVWSAFGVSLGDEVHAGHQSRVFRADGPTGRRILKLTDGRQADSAYRRRVELLALLAETNSHVVGPLPLSADLVTEIGDWLVVSYPVVDGTTPDSDSTTDVFTMAVTLASLHDSLNTLPSFDLPPVAALRQTSAGPLLGDRLIHGDYASANLIVSDTGMRIIDFDDCGYGSVDFEIGNTLYMVLFDAWLAEDPGHYERFRETFVGAYRMLSSAVLDDAILDDAIRVRIGALERWIDDPVDAPIGIRSAPPEWHQRLRTFVRTARP